MEDIVITLVVKADTDYGTLTVRDILHMMLTFEETNPIRGLDIVSLTASHVEE